MGGNMKKKRRVHPTIEEIDSELLQKFNISPSLAIKQRTCQLATGDNTLAIREEMLKQKKTEYLKDIEMLNNRLIQVDSELEEIRLLKQNYNPLNSKNYDEALGEVTRKLGAVLKEDEDGSWDLKKVTLKEVANTCNSYGVSVESVLSNVHSNLLKYLDGYTRRL